jgi:hypothetical protein
MAEILKHVEATVHIEKQWLIAAIRQQGHNGALDLLANVGAAIEGDGEVKYELFATENPDTIYMKYTISLSCIDVSAGGRTNMELVLQGSGNYYPSPQKIDSIMVESENLVFAASDGSTGNVKNAYMRGHVTLGHKTVKHSTRHLIKRS